VGDVHNATSGRIANLSNIELINRSPWLDFCAEALGVKARILKWIGAMTHIMRFDIPTITGVGFCWVPRR
jgi:hypothetical protein